MRHQILVAALSAVTGSRSSAGHRSLASPRNPVLLCLGWTAGVRPARALIAVDAAVRAGAVPPNRPPTSGRPVLAHRCSEPHLLYSLFRFHRSEALPYGAASTCSPSERQRPRRGGSPDRHRRGSGHPRRPHPSPAAGFCARPAGRGPRYVVMREGAPHPQADVCTRRPGGLRAEAGRRAQEGAGIPATADR